MLLFLCPDFELDPLTLMFKFDLDRYWPAYMPKWIFLHLSIQKLVPNNKNPRVLQGFMQS